jgi:hypothetical protein
MNRAQEVEEAYREGFEDGSLQASQYERGHMFTDVKACWKTSDAKLELEKTDADRLIENLEEADRIVGSWPAWKQNCLGNQPTCKQPRKPI